MQIKLLICAQHSDTAAKIRSSQKIYAQVWIIIRNHCEELDELNFMDHGYYHAHSISLRVE